MPGVRRGLRVLDGSARVCGGVRIIEVVVLFVSQLVGEFLEVFFVHLGGLGKLGGGFLRGFVLGAVVIFECLELGVLVVLEMLGRPCFEVLGADYFFFMVGFLTALGPLLVPVLISGGGFFFWPAVVDFFGLRVGFRGLF